MKANNPTILPFTKTEEFPNSEFKTFTPDKLREFEGCEHYSDVQASEIIKSLEKLSSIFFNMLHDLKSNNIDNQQVVYLNSREETKLKAA